MDVTLDKVGRTVDYHGIGLTTMAQLTGGVFLTGYMLALGSSELLIAVVAAFPLLSKLSQLYTSWQIERKGHWPQTTLRGAWLGRVPLLLAAAIPLMPLSDTLAVWTLALVIAISSLGGSIYEIGFLTWMAELVPAARRGEFWGKRTRIAEFAGLVVALAASYLFDQWYRDHPGMLGGYVVVFGAGALAGLVAIAFLRRIPVPESEHRKQRQVSLSESLLRPTHDANFRRLLSFVGVWGFAVGIVGPFTTVYMLQELSLSFLPTTLFTVLPAALVATIQIYWGRLSDHFGNKPVLRTASYLIALIPAVWMFTTPERIWPIWIAQILTGIGWAAYNICMSNLVLKLAPDGSRSSYIASLGALFAVTQAVSPLLGGAALGIIKDAGIASLTAYYTLFAASFLLRVVATPMLGRVDEPGGTAVGHMIRVIGRFRSMSSSFAPDFVFSHAFTHLARAADFITREGKSSRQPQSPTAPRS